MNQSEKPRRFRTRDNVRDVEISETREQELCEAFAEVIPAERPHNRLAATFDADPEIDKAGVVVSSRLHHERIFDMCASYASGGEPDGEEIFASATVKDVDTDARLAAHVAKNRVLISLKDGDVSFETFRDYILFLENRLNISLTPDLS